MLMVYDIVQGVGCDMNDVSAAQDVEGHAFLTSSSADEAAQESDRIGGSFFTHYLITGLRGGADANADGKVTLGEAYQFAFAETVEPVASEAEPYAAAFERWTAWRAASTTVDAAASPLTMPFALAGQQARAVD